jgi:hypothetical protein
VRDETGTDAAVMEVEEETDTGIDVDLVADAAVMEIVSETPDGR